MCCVETHISAVWYSSENLEVSLGSLKPIRITRVTRSGCPHYKGGCYRCPTRTQLHRTFRPGISILRKSRTGPFPAPPPRPTHRSRFRQGRTKGRRSDNFITAYGVTLSLALTSRWGTTATLRIVIEVMPPKATSGRLSVATKRSQRPYPASVPLGSRFIIKLQNASRLSIHN
ncbi:unnamed protein product [Pieris brassicae]|uniref:Uncharacterized protein n=1 Tax=Pieris brassicae TaxID=7116 RepID=A0A9P0TUM0_PIEBR|nr:unnamed protein product [Pieris brassicae]